MQIGPGKGQGGQGRRLLRGDLLVGVGHRAVAGQAVDGIQHRIQVPGGAVGHAVEHVPHRPLVVGEVQGWTGIVSGDHRPGPSLQGPRYRLVQDLPIQGRGDVLVDHAGKGAGDAAGGGEDAGEALAGSGDVAPQELVYPGRRSGWRCRSPPACCSCWPRRSAPPGCRRRSECSCR